MQTKIMIIDADAPMIVRLTSHLRHLGYSTASFSKTAGAIDAVINERPDWLLLDVDKPLFDAPAFCELLRRAVPVDRLRVLLYSSMPEPKGREMVLKCRARGWIPKDQLLERLASKIDGYARKLSIVPPPNEPQRLKALRSYAILDTPAEEDFDGLTRLASIVCGTPIALMSLIDSERQWFKSNVGLNVSQTPRSVAFCAHAIHGTSILEVPDASKDERFAQNPLVKFDPNIRFYAGAPLTTPAGDAIGTMCVIDRKPRTLTEAQRDALATIARQVMRLLEMRRLAAAESSEAPSFRQPPLPFVSEHDRQHMLRPDLGSASFGGR